MAEVGARALLTDQLIGRRIAVTGPQSLTHEEMVTTIGDVIGRPLRYQEIPPEAARCLRAECRREFLGVLGFHLLH